MNRRPLLATVGALVAVAVGVGGATAGLPDEAESTPTRDSTILPGTRHELPTVAGAPDSDRRRTHRLLIGATPRRRRPRRGAGRTRSARGALRNPRTRTSTSGRRTSLTMSRRRRRSRSRGSTTTATTGNGGMATGFGRSTADRSSLTSGTTWNQNTRGRHPASRESLGPGRR
jgi:hypothetical protein